MKNLLLLGLLSTIYACSHPIEIVGEGDVMSATGTRNCYLEDFQAKKENCTKNLVQGAYNETYYAVPRPGWEFDKWINYCADAVSNECAFVIPADTVQNNWGATVPSLVAVFMQIPAPPPEPPPEPEPPSFPSVDQDGNVSFATAKVVSDQSITNDTVSSSRDADHFKFTAGETAFYSVALEFTKPDIRLYWYNDDANATLVGEARTSGVTKQVLEGKRLEKGKTYYIGVQAISQQEIQNYKLTISRGDVIPVGPGIVTIDPDDYADGADMSNPHAQLSLSAVARGQPSLPIISKEGAFGSTSGSNGFHLISQSYEYYNLFGLYGLINTCVNSGDGSGPSFCGDYPSLGMMVGEFSTPTDFVSLIGDTAVDGVALLGYDAAGNLLVSDYDGTYPPVGFKSVSISRSSRDIAYFAVFGADSTVAYLYALHFNAAATEAGEE